MSQNQVSQVRTTRQEPGLERRILTFKATYVIWLLLSVLEAAIGLRIILKLIAANPNNPFASLVYGFTDVFLFPFAGLLPTPASGGMVLEISSLIAMIVYALVAYAIERLVWVIFYRPREQAVAVTQSTSSQQHTP